MRQWLALKCCRKNGHVSLNTLVRRMSAATKPRLSGRGALLIVNITLFLERGKNRHFHTCRPFHFTPMMLFAHFSNIYLRIDFYVSFCSAICCLSLQPPPPMLFNNYANVHFWICCHITGASYKNAEHLFAHANFYNHFIVSIFFEKLKNVEH